MTIRRHKIYWLTGLIALWCIGSVFAYWTQELWTHNEFQTARYDTELKEKFVSPDNWLPGEEIEKDIWVTNQGSVSVFSKIVLHQEWIREENVTDFDGTIIAPAEGEAFPLVFDTEQGKEYAAQIIWGNQTVLLESGKCDEIDLGIPVVEQIHDAEGKWLLINEQPDSDGNYTLYYIGLIGKNQNTPVVVDAVTMNPQIKPAVLLKNHYFDKETKKWITQSERNTTYDYECSKYTMLVTATTVQATEDAVKEIFGTESDSKEVVDYLAAHTTETSWSVNASESKKLYFEEQNGRIAWNPKRGDDGNCLMSFTNLIPGCHYADQLQIENGSKKTYKLYAQVIPKRQETEKEELLERISMKVTLDSELLYEGSASGQDYENGNLQNVIYLGIYEPGKQSMLNIELEVDKNLGIECCDILTENDWKFMVTELEKTEEAVKEIQPPKTGDYSGWIVYAAAVVISLLGLILIKMIRREKIQ